jgi:sterol desaturase/sphingolipid hydroxylase (fatty acid hydroxylase superfamily)
MTANSIKWFIYPIVMTFGVMQFFWILSFGQSHLEMATTVPMIFMMLSCFFLERVFPYDKNWKPEGTDWGIDTLHLILFQTILPKAFKIVFILLVLHFLPNNVEFIHGVWPHHWPLIIQGLMMLFISDFFRYWIHRFSHTFPFLWRFHAVHHALKKLYWLNTTRIHPGEKILQLIWEVGPFICIGVSKEVIALHLVLYGLNGFLRHSNIDMKFGPLNYILSTNELHRWHHSKVISESNANYGSDTAIWDLLFGTFFWPKDEKVKEIGVFNKNYPQNFKGQMEAPLVNDIDKEDKLPFNWKHFLLNILLKVKMGKNRKKFQGLLLQETKDVERIQKVLLKKLLSENANTKFGLQHKFENIQSIGEFQSKIPVHTYEDLRSWIEEQSVCKEEVLLSNPIVMFNQTSGSTAKPKWIPVTQETLYGLKNSQQLSTWLQYTYAPEAFEGHIMGIVSPAQESMSEFGIPVGSASGHFYKNMPQIVKKKYVLPHEVFEVKDYQVKYYLILLLALQHKDITYIGSANPSTFLQLNNILKERKDDLINDLRAKSPLSVQSEIPKRLFERVSKLLNPTKERIEEVNELLQMKSSEIKHFLPHLKLLVTWTCGSCGIALQAALKLLPENIKVADLGYLSSEFRGSVTYDYSKQSGLPTYKDHFFEFVLKDEWENGESNFKLLHQIEKGHDYYIFITTPSGLWRYNMNDIVRVTGFLNQCPLITFQQKGNGACNITGEKLYESQIIEAFQSMQWKAMYYQVLADVNDSRYIGYIEWHNEPNESQEELSAIMDESLAKLNVEYAEKRASKRLNPFVLKYLPPGSFTQIKKQAVEAGQKEGQFKMVMLQYKDQFKWDLSQAK